MRALTVEEIKEKELELLLLFRQICEEQNLRFYLAGGTLLGAVRHRGFIPWDDDIDVCMARPDYERLRTLCHSRSLFPEHIRMCCFEDGSYDLPFMKLYDLRIRVSNDHYDDLVDPYLWIDILPVDGLPGDEHGVEAIYEEIGKTRRVLLAGLSKAGHGRTRLKRIAKQLLFRPYVKLRGVRHFSGKIARIAAKQPYESSPCCGIVTWGLYGPGERMEKAGFEKSESVFFEGQRFETMSCWDAYLRGIYGDYMQLPPVEKRVSHALHAVLAEESNDKTYGERQ